VGLGKWPEARPLIENFENEIASEGFRLLPIEIPHVRAAGLMQVAHRDPFDRLLVAQAAREGLTLVTSDQVLGDLGAVCLW
jgi:PIN domain nuclease of toxin-antitoxin system